MDISFPGQCVDGYLEWYYRVSHPHIIPRGSIEPIYVTRPSYIGGHSYDIFPPPPLGMSDQEKIQMIALLSNNLMGMVNLDGEVYALALHLKYIPMVD